MVHVNIDRCTQSFNSSSRTFRYLRRVELTNNGVHMDETARTRQYGILVGRTEGGLDIDSRYRGASRPDIYEPS